MTGRAPANVVEAVEVEGRPINEIQWHPERFSTDPVFDWLVAASFAHADHDPKEHCS